MCMTRRGELTRMGKGDVQAQAKFVANLLHVAA